MVFLQYHARSVTACSLILAAGLGGCSSGLKLTRVDAAHRKPSNVAVFFAVQDSDGEPVADLLATDFKIYEDGRIVSIDESRQTIVNPEVAAVHQTLLLVDMSASVTESDQVAQIVQASSEFSAQIESHQKVAVYAFDGSRDIHEIAPFSESGERAAAALGSLADFHTKDPSTNLNGAVVQGLDRLDESLDRATVPLRFGTLVVFTDGTDRAARVSLQEMVDAIDASQYEVYAIGVGNEIDDATLARIGRSGYIRVNDSAAIKSAFNQIGDRILAYTRRYYLLSYCSPARAGKHTVTIEAHAQDTSGQLTHEFDAKGFEPGCDASAPPPFDTSGRTARSRKKLGLAPDNRAPEKKPAKKAAQPAPATQPAQPAQPVEPVPPPS
jgi:hypothetical protein